MSLSPYQIRLLAVYFTDAQLHELFGIESLKINEAFLDMDRPRPSTGRLLTVLERSDQLHLEQEALFEIARAQTAAIGGHVKDLLNDVSLSIDASRASINNRLPQPPPK